MGKWGSWDRYFVVCRRGARIEYGALGDFGTEGAAIGAEGATGADGTVREDGMDGMDGVLVTTEQRQRLLLEWQVPFHQFDQQHHA